MSKLRIFCLLVSGILLADAAEAERVCLRTQIKRGRPVNSSKVVPDDKKCPKGFSQLFKTSDVLGGSALASIATSLKGEVGPQGVEGPPGPKGETGEDGSLRMYGNGSSGDLIVSSSRTISPEEISAQFENCLVQTGVNFTVSHGVTLRCRGSFENQGTITVSDAGESTAGFTVFFNGAVAPAVRQPIGGMGIVVPAGQGVFSPSGGLVTGGRADNGAVAQRSAQSVRDPVRAFGGGGAAGLALGGVVSSGGAGGGAILILAKNGIRNSGLIAADGDGTANPGAGGGAGGTILLASPAFVENTGTLRARGGQGGNASVNVGFGGAGGGGFIHFISPNVTIGSTDVSPGLPGSVPPGLTPNLARSGGGAGGSSVGSGSFGGSIRENNTYVFSSSTDGNAGAVLTTREDPTPLF